MKSASEIKSGFTAKTVILVTIASFLMLLVTLLRGYDRLWFGIWTPLNALDGNAFVWGWGIGYFALLLVALINKVAGKPIFSREEVTVIFIIIPMAGFMIGGLSTYALYGTMMADMHYRVKPGDEAWALVPDFMAPLKDAEVVKALYLHGQFPTLDLGFHLYVGSSSYLSGLISLLYLSPCFSSVRYISIRKCYSFP